MNTSSLLLAVAMVALYVFLWIGAPTLLVGWLRSRRQEAIRYQMALTRPVPIGRILAIAHGVLSGVDRVNPGRYQVVLTPKEKPPPQGENGPPRPIRGKLDSEPVCSHAGVPDQVSSSAIVTCDSASLPRPLPAAPAHPVLALR